MRTASGRFAQPVASDRERNIAAASPILSRNELPVHNQSRLPRSGPLGGVNSANDRGDARQPDVNVSGGGDFGVD